ncbi:murein L,D-transpeptidase catalytic domain-containing protein [Flaviaesturariibacter amylovorans]
MNRLLVYFLPVAGLLLAAGLFLHSAGGVAKPGSGNAPRVAAAPAAKRAAPAAGATTAATATAQRRSRHARELISFARRNGYSTHIAFLIDMRLPSGRARFFIHDLVRDSVLAAGLVAHGSCNAGFLEEASFSAEPGCGCSSLGRYKVGYSYTGNYGKAFKLYGLDSSNRTAFERFVVLHAYRCVPDTEVYPESICNSLGCPMVSNRFLETAAGYLARERKPVLLWVYR